MTAFPFSHRWTVVNFDWLCENVKGHQKIETKIQYPSTSNEPNKWITLELWPKGFDAECLKYISVQIFADDYLFVRVWIVGNDSNERLFIKENSNKVLKKITFRKYIQRLQYLPGSTLLLNNSFSVCIEGVICKIKNFNILKNINKINELIGSATVTHDTFDFMQAIHSACISKWTIDNFRAQIRSGTKRFENIVKFRKDIKFGLVLVESEASTWEIYLRLLSPISGKLFMWFRMMKIDDDEKDNSLIIQNVQQVKVFKEVNEAMPFKIIDIKKLLANKKKYFPTGKLEFSFEMIRLKNIFHHFNHVQQETKLEEFVMKRFAIFNYIFPDALKLFLKNNKPKTVEVLPEDLVKNLISKKEKQNKLFSTVKNIITNLDTENIKNGSTITYNLHNVFMATNGSLSTGNIQIIEKAISEETYAQFQKLFENSLMKLNNELNSKIQYLQDSIEKVYEIKQSGFALDKEGVQVTIKIEDFNKMLSYFIKVLMRFVTDETEIDKLLDGNWWRKDDENSMIFNGNIAKAAKESEKDLSANTENSQDISRSKRNLNREISTIITNESIDIPITNSEIIFYWSSIFAFGDLNEMRTKFPLPQLTSIRIHAESLVNSYENRNQIMKHSHFNRMLDLSKLIIEQINELTLNEWEGDPIRYITADYLNQQFE